MSRTPLASVEEFLAGDSLRRADVVLCAGRKSLFSRVIRFGTKSPFSHAAAVFVVPKRDLGFNNTFLIESGTSGVDITDLRHYLIDKSDSYQVAIKRLEKPWFQEGEEGKGLQKLVRGQMLDFIKADYDYATIFLIARQIVRRMIFGFQLLRGQAPHRLIAADKAPNEFICSGLVQYGFYAALCRHLLQTAERDGRASTANRAEAEVNLTRDDDLEAKRNLLDAAREARQEQRLQPSDRGPGSLREMAKAMSGSRLERLEEVDFASAGEKEDPLTALLATTPEDLAKTEKLTWKYVISEGQVYEAASYDEAREVLDG